MGRSGRTNADGIDQLQSLVAPFDYTVVPVEFSGCLHLKSAVTAVADDLVLVNPDWISTRAFPGWETLRIDPREPYGANALRIGGTVVYPSQHPRTRDLMAARGLRVVTTETSELAKAEGAVTCCSLIFEHGVEDRSEGRNDA